MLEQETPETKPRWWIWLGSLSFLGVAIFVLSALFFQVPDFSEMRHSVSLDVRDSQGNATQRRVGPKTPGWVPMDEISEFVVLAVVASEDTTFFSHDGVDFHEIKEAIKKDIKEKRFARGASTLTQQVVKNVYLTKNKSLWRKLKEFFWARELEKVLTKKEIINFYLNMAEFGPGIYGVGEASRYYFDNTPSNVTTKQAAFLAMLLPSPRKYHQSFEERKLTEWANKRVARILTVMKNLNLITEPTFDSAMNEDLWNIPRASTLETVTESAPQEEVAPPPEENPATATTEDPNLPVDGSID